MKRICWPGPGALSVVSVFQGRVFAVGGACNSRYWALITSDGKLVSVKMTVFELLKSYSFYGCRVLW